MSSDEIARKSIICDVYSGTRSIGKFAFDRDLIRIGRDPGCEIQLVVPTASRVHCQIERTLGGFELRDPASKNGTLLNGRPVTAALLESGDVISIGEFRIWTTIASTEETRMFPESPGAVLPTMSAPDVFSKRKDP